MVHFRPVSGTLSNRWRHNDNGNGNGNGNGNTEFRIEQAGKYTIRFGAKGENGGYQPEDQWAQVTLDIGVDISWIQAVDGDDESKWAKDVSNLEESEIKTLYVCCVKDEEADEEGEGGEQHYVNIEVKPDPAEAEEDELPDGWEIKKISGNLDFAPAEEGEENPGKLTAKISKSEAGEIIVGVVSSDECEDHYQVRVVMVKTEIINTPDVYYADADADVPIVIRMTGPSTLLENITKDDIKQIEVNFCVGVSEYDFNQIRIYEGNKMDEDSSQDNVYTLVIKENKYNNIEVQQDLSTDVNYKLSFILRINSERVLKCKSFDGYNIESFGDKDIEVYELGENENILIGDSAQHQKQIASKEAYCTIWHLEGRGGVGEPEELEKLQSDYYFDEGYATTTGFRNSHWYGLDAKLYDDWDATGVGAGHLFKVEALEERRGIYFGVYYGRKTLSDGTKIVDVNYKSGNLTVQGDQNAYFWGKLYSVDNKNNIGWEFYFSTAVTIVGFGMWPPTWPAVVYTVSTTIVSTILGDSLVGDEDETADINTLYVFLINDKEGESAVDDSEPTGGPYSFSFEGTTEDDWQVGAIIKSEDKYVEFGDTVTAYTCGLIWCQTRSAGWTTSYIRAQLQYNSYAPAVKIFKAR